MAYSIQEQEEIEGFKHFWKNGGSLICGVVVMALLGYGGWKFYQNQQAKNAAQASVALSKFTEEFMGKKTEEAQKQLTILQTEHKNNNAAAMASLSMAGLYFDQKKYTEAQKELEWVLANTQDPTLNALAIQRLANLFLHQEKYDLALNMINKPVNSVYEPISLDIKGDILFAQGKKKEAAQSYEQALLKLPKDAVGKEIIELKKSQCES